MREGWIERSGVRLHYLEWAPEGDPQEPALFMLHGLSSNAMVWERIARRLPGRRIVALDQRSHGPSDRPPDSYASSELVDDAVHAIEELGLGRPLVLGHSWGASVALELAATRPEVAAGLVFVDGPPAAMKRVMTWVEASRRMQPPFPIYSDLDQAVEAQQQYLGEAWAEDLRPFVRAGLVDIDGGLTSTLTVDIRRQILEKMFEFDPLAYFPRVEGPVLLAMAGQLWPGAPVEFEEGRRLAVEEVLAARPDTAVRWYESRHDVPLIRPAELAADVERTALAAAFASVAGEATRLEGEWTRKVHGLEAGADGWTARDLLAHLASTQSSLAAVATTQPKADDGRPRQPFDPDRWNASQLARRRDASPEDLLAELRQGAEALQAALMNVELKAPVGTGRYAGHPVDEAMRSMAAHQRGHLGELREALAAGGGVAQEESC
jgi:pimeloyl-ACP methyl ester carboxylesterase